MPLSKCILDNCNNSSCHSLPRDVALRQKWIEALKIDVNVTRIRPYSRICSAHFKPDDFVYTTPYGISQKRLKKFAVPSIVDGSKHKQQLLSTLHTDSREERGEQLLTERNIDKTVVLKTISEPVQQVKWINLKRQASPTKTWVSIAPKHLSCSMSHSEKKNENGLFEDPKTAEVFYREKQLPKIKVYKPADSKPNIAKLIPLKVSEVHKTYTRPILPTAFVQELPCLGTQESKNDSNNADPLADEKGIKTESCSGLDQLSAVTTTHCQEVVIKLEPEPDVELRQLTNAVHLGRDIKIENDDGTKKVKDPSSNFSIEIEINGQCTQDSRDHQKKKACECQKLKTTSVHVQQSDKYVQTDDIQYDGLCIHKMRKKEHEIQFYTGLKNFNQFQIIFDSLGPSAYHLLYYYNQPPKHLDPMNQLLLVLILLYKNKTYEELAILFKTNIKAIFNLVITWIRFMALQWKQLNLWADKDTLRSHVPPADLKPPTHILDVIECHVRKPHHESAQQMINLLANKDQICVLKFLIVISPGGAISHVSPAYGGAATDRQIIERSDILRRFTPDDEVLVGKGINTEAFLGTNSIRDMFEPLGVKVHTPGLSKKNGHPLVSTVLTPFHKRVVQRCVEVERELMRFKFLCAPLSHADAMLASDIVFVCCMLVNFKLSFKTSERS